VYVCVCVCVCVRERERENVYILSAGEHKDIKLIKFFERVVFRLMAKYFKRDSREAFGLCVSARVLKEVYQTPHPDPQTVDLECLELNQVRSRTPGCEETTDAIETV
jgi:hypothetical protein